MQLAFPSIKFPGNRPGHQGIRQKLCDFNPQHWNICMLWCTTWKWTLVRYRYIHIFVAGVAVYFCRHCCRIRISSKDQIPFPFPFPFPFSPSSDGRESSGAAIRQPVRYRQPRISAPLTKFPCAHDSRRQRI
ncbi:hypothetical protein CONLIGDRAFT_83936 [Coniochaeta ligniaria NRRL 30616]|uniref:Uncharacterized protein n=1 Tax=Coniochaeta ligniaria NRRL 30616 TaxID=1408157 RepID=A0A1J7ICM4_9PEZI|nr:hypothetical protein CONLIGDRAFT_83936 [Coniochaeta ligniaria NRRL 30616]